MEAINREESSDFWREQRIALLEYIEAARDSDGGNEQSSVRFEALGAGIQKIDAKIGQLGKSSAKCQTVLVVDDNPEIVHLVCLFLRGAGLTCLAAIGPTNALSVWKEHQDIISVVISDLQMPGLNGDQLAARFLKEKPDLNVVFTSGTPWITGTPLTEGVNFFAKPFRLSDVSKRIKELVRS